MTGAIPRLGGAAVCVAFQTVGDAITAIAPFYMSCEGGLNARVVTPRHHAIPRLGWVGNGKRVSQALRAHKLAPQLLKVMRTFTCTTYDGALLLDALSRVRPELACSMTAVQTTLSNYRTHRRNFESPPSMARRATRSLSISPFEKGNRVFIYLPAVDEWYPGVVRMVHRADSLSVAYDNPQLTRIDDDASCKPTSEVRPDIVHEPVVRGEGTMGVGKPDGEEDADDTKATFAQLMVCIPLAPPPLSILSTQPVNHKVSQPDNH